MAQGSEIAEAIRLAGISMREAGHRAARGMLRFGMAIHSSREMATGPGEAMLICAQCRPVRAWPCEHYEKIERDLVEIEARWAREDEAKAAC